MADDENRENELDESEWDQRNPLEDPDGPQECDLAGQDDDAPDTEPCPKCGQEILEDADQCPYCGEWVVQGSGNPPTSHGVVFIFAAVAVLLILAYLLL